jgi:hypothetical protein
MNLHTTFTEARLKFDTERREQAELARQGLELKLAQRDVLKAAAEIKDALAKLEATKAAPAPPKPATAAPEAKAAVPARKVITKAPTAKPAAPKASPKRRASPLNLAIDNLEHRLAAVSAKIAALAARTK